MKNCRNTLLAAALALAPALAAADISWYGGFGVGGSRVEEDLNLTFSASVYDSNDVLQEVASASLDKFNGTDLGYRLFGGMMIGRFVGFEVGYVNLGKPEDEISLSIPSGATGIPVTDVNLVLQDEFDGVEAYAIGALPIGERWSLFAKLGVLNWDSKFTATNYFRDTYPPSAPGGGAVLPIPVTEPASFENSDDGTDLAGGLGFNYKAGEHLALRGEGTWYDIDDTEQVWLLGLNLVFTY